MPDAKTIATYDAKARDYAKLVSTDAPDASLLDFINALPAGGTVLDLGCGPATASAHMRAAGLAPDPVDASPGMVALANETHDIGARLGVFDDIDGVAAYDGVWANFSLLHAPRDDLPRHMAALARALKPGGLLHIGMKTGDGSKRDAMDRLYTFVAQDELTKLVTDAGLSVTWTKTGKERGMAGTMDPYILMRARKDG